MLAGREHTPAYMPAAAAVCAAASLILVARTVFVYSNLLSVKRGILNSRDERPVYDDVRNVWTSHQRERLAWLDRLHNPLNDMILSLALTLALKALVELAATSFVALQPIENCRDTQYVIRRRDIGPMQCTASAGLVGYFNALAVCLLLWTLLLAAVPQLHFPHCCNCCGTHVYGFAWASSLIIAGGEVALQFYFAPLAADGSRFEFDIAACRMRRTLGDGGYNRYSFWRYLTCALLLVVLLCFAMSRLRGVVRDYRSSGEGSTWIDFVNARAVYVRMLPLPLFFAVVLLLLAFRVIDGSERGNRVDVGMLGVLDPASGAVVCVLWAWMEGLLRPVFGMWRRSVAVVDAWRPQEPLPFSHVLLIGNTRAAWRYYEPFATEPTESSRPRHTRLPSIVSTAGPSPVP